MQTLRELFDAELASVAALERGLGVAFADLADESARKDIRRAFLRLQRQTLKGVKRLERVAEALRQPAEADRSLALDGILREKEAFVAAAPTDELLDYYNLQLAARLLRYAAGAYEGAIETAERLQLPRVAHALRANLEEKLAALTELHDLTHAFEVAFRQAGGVLEPVPPERKARDRALLTG